MRISDWSSDVCSSDLAAGVPFLRPHRRHAAAAVLRRADLHVSLAAALSHRAGARLRHQCHHPVRHRHLPRRLCQDGARSEEHTSELQSLMRISYAVFCLKKKKNTHTIEYAIQYT